MLSLLLRLSLFCTSKYVYNSYELYRTVFNKFIVLLKSDFIMSQSAIVIEFWPIKSRRRQMSELQSSFMEGKNPVVGGGV